MKIPMPKGTSESSERFESDRVEEAVIEAIKESNDKTIEIRPADKSKGRGISRVLLFVGAAIGLSYWMRKSQKPKEIFRRAKNKTAGRTEEISEQAADRTEEMSERAANRTEEMSEQAAETIQEGGEAVAERVEEGSQEAGKELQMKGEEAAEATEKAGEEAAKKADEDGSNY